MNQFTKMRRSKMIAGAAGIMALTASSWGQTADALIDKLVEKGILSVKEANNLREETDKGFNQAYSVKSGMPDWVTSLKLNGDFRLRYDGAYQDDDNAMIGVQPPFTSPATAQTEDRNRFRYRARFGVTVVMADQFEVGLRLASGDGINAVGADPISTNTSFDNNGTKKAVNIDLAYAKWTPKDWLMVEGGKMNNEFWMSDMVFDGDYTPEGAQEKLAYAINDKHAVSWTSGQFVIDENFSGTPSLTPGLPNNNNDVYLFVNQVDWAAKWTPKMTSRIAAGIMNFHNYKDNSVIIPPG
ncbi:MAG: putative porin, partial [Opitutaceae bacterium]|nr:putative porin [Verrucomicrobiales bacterium]